MAQTLAEIQAFKGKYPKQLWALFFSEMWERFCFYGMRGMLTLFMVDVLLMKEDIANLQYGATQAFVYAFTFIGGLFADKLLGFQKSLLWGGLLMIIGSLILAFDPSRFFFIGISFTIVGTGFFKPNISTMVGALYKADDTRRDAGFSLFYAGINLGALIGGYLCVYTGKNYSWNLAFGFAAIVMTLSLITFLFTQKQLGPIGKSPLLHLPTKKRLTIELLVFLGSLLCLPAIVAMVSKTAYTDLFMYSIGPIALAYLGFEMRKCTVEENKKLLAALVFILFSIVFWSFFEQSGGSLSLFAANNLHDTLYGFTLDPNGVNNAANSLFIILFAPLVGLLWIVLSKYKLEPTTLNKFAWSFVFLAGAFYLFYYSIYTSDGAGLTSLELFTLAYFVITLGELCLSPIGLSIMTKLAPERLSGMMMGLWFLASAYGQYVAGILGAGMSMPESNATNIEKLNTYTQGFKQLGLFAFIAGLLLFLLAKPVQKLMGSIK